MTYLKPITLAFTALLAIAGYSQINPDEYLTAGEISEKGAEYYAQEHYDKAYLEFMKIHYNDTAYFDARLDAIHCASAQKHYDTVINVCRDVLQARKYNYKKEDFTNALGHALNQKEKYEEALSFLDEALKEYPRNYLMHFNRANALDKLDRRDEAVEALQTSISYNPKYFASHWRLGIMCAEAGHLTKAALCINMTALLNATEDNNAAYLAILESLYAGKVENKGKAIKFREDEDFSEIDLLIKNKVAENPKYKVKVKLDFPFIKHNHLVFEKLKYDPNSKGFWNQNYVRTFSEIFHKNHFPSFSYLQCVSIEHAPTQKIVKKNETRINEFIDWSILEYTKHMNERQIWADGKYINPDLNHYGTYGFNEEVKKEGDKMIGPYIGYSTTGLINAKGTFNEDGKYEGAWKFYEDGLLSTQAEFKNGELHGKRTTYYHNGSRRRVMTIVDDKLDGPIEEYYSCNQIYNRIPYDDNGKEHGEAEYYYSTGEVSHRFNLKYGRLDGTYKSFFKDGSVKSESNYVDGKMDGAYKTFHKNGKPHVSGQYELDEPIGHWTYSYDNGQLQEEGDFKNGLRVGLWKSYSYHGKLSEETNYGETGKKTGIYKQYDYDQNLILELEYKGEEINSYKTYDSNGKLLSQGEKKKKELEFTGHHANGEVRVQGNYYKGEYVGNWKYYNEYGVLIKELNYNEKGELDGQSKWYFENGQLETIKNFTEGVIDGYFVDYYRNGKIFKHGWYKEGEIVGEWETYFRDGTLSSTKYYLEDEPHGDIVYYDEKGRISEISRYFYGAFNGVIMFDTNGVETGQYMLKDGAAVNEYKDQNDKLKVRKEYRGGKQNGEQVSYYANGQMSSKGLVVDGDREGEWKWYYRDGSLSSEGAYSEGERSGKWKWYFKNGKVSSEREYDRGMQTGKSVRYYENGKIERENNYRYDERHGESVYYSENGDVQLIRYYQDGIMLGYSYMDESGNPVKMIPFNNQNGVMEATFPSGKKSYHSEYKNGFNQGKTYYYHSNGKVAEERTYEKGQLDGWYKEYYPDGTLREEEEYQEGDRHGVSKTYHPNGKLKEIRHYVMDSLYGWTILYNAKGEETERIYYYNGRQLN